MFLNDELYSISLGEICSPEDVSQEADAEGVFVAGGHVAIENEVSVLKMALGEIYGEGWERKRGTLVVVDDNPGDRALVKNSLAYELGELGLSDRVKYFDDGDKALDWMADPANRETVLLTVSDREMPRVSGESLAFNLREELRENLIPFIMVTGSIPPGEMLDKDVDGHTGAGAKVDALVDGGYIDAVAGKPLPLNDPQQIVRMVLWTVMKRLEEVKGARRSGLAG